MKEYIIKECKRQIEELERFNQEILIKDIVEKITLIKRERFSNVGFYSKNEITNNYGDYYGEIIIDVLESEVYDFKKEKK